MTIEQGIRVYLVDDHALFRTGVRAELARAGTADPGGPPVVVVGEGGSVDEAVTGIRHLRPDVVLLDVHMPDGKEIAAELFISIKTVETHVSSVLRKTQLSNRYELSRWASDRRLV